MHRGTRTERGYDNRWLRASANWRKEHPLCVWCKGAGRPVAASCVDHIVPHQGNKELFWDITNWQSLCASCHSVKTRLDQTGRVLNWVPRTGLVVVLGEERAHVVLVSGKMLIAYVATIEARMRQEGRCTVQVCSGLFDAFEVARRLRAGLVATHHRSGWSPNDLVV